jgi:HK97 family phage prohead protease
MHIHESFAAPAELKFIDGEPDGTYGGLGAVFGNTDSHGDVIARGAFADSLAAHKAAGTMPKMFVEHSAFTGGDPLPIGVWTHMEEVAEGLRVKGRLIGLQHPNIARIYELMKADALPGLSIGFIPAPDGAVIGRKASEPRRTLTKVKLVSVDLVGDPSNPLARIEGLKSVMLQADQQTAAEALAAAMKLHQETLAGGNAPSSEQRAALMGHLQTAHLALTGHSMPAGMKAAPPETIREFEKWLCDPVVGFGWSRSRARSVAEGGFKSSQPRDEGRDPAVVAEPETLSTLRSALDGFSLPSF